MTAELVTVCVALVAAVALAVWALSSRDELRTTIDRLTDERDEARAETENLRTAIDADARGVEIGRLIVELDGREHVEADPARAMPRPRLVPDERRRT